MSPLLVVSQDRQYAQAAKQGAALQPAAQRAAAGEPAELYRRADSFVPPAHEGAAVAAAAQAPGGVSGLEAMYGPATGAAQQQPKQAGPAAGAGPAAAAAAASWGGLFDAPSHVLPPLSTLCPAFLELVLGREGVRQEGSGAEQ